METASWVLLIVVSSALTLFLIVLVAAIAYVITILRKVNRIAEQAEDAVDSVRDVAETFGRSATPLAAAKTVTKIVKTIYKIGKKR